MIVKGVDGLKIYVDKNALQDYTTKLIAKEKTIFATKDQVGSPLVASTVAGMTDHDKIYVYVGSETGYTSGNWYYWDGTAWTSGGVYNSEGFVLDDTLTSATLPAQAKAVGDKVSQLSEEIDDVNKPLNVYISDPSTLDWELGGIGSNGKNSDANTRWRMKDAIYVKSGSKVSIDPAYRFFLAIYTDWTDAATFTLDTTVARTADPYTFTADRYVRIVLSDATSSTDVTNMKDTLVGALDVYLINKINAIDDINTALQKAFTGTGVRVSSTDQLASLDVAVPNRCYTLVAKIDENQPSNYGDLITFNYTDTPNSNGCVQFWYSTNGYMFIRIKWSNTWSSWKRVVDPAFMQTDGNYADISMFERIGVIGDSFASGTIYTGVETEDTNNFPLSWPQNLARQCGITAVNYSRGGETTQSFLTSGVRRMQALLDDISGGNGCGLYILCLGINDSNVNKTGGLAYLGTSADINLSDYTQNADSFWGNYGRIIQQIVEASPNSKIVMTTYCRQPTEATEAAYDAFNEAIQEIAAFFEIPCLVLTDDEFFNSRYYMNNMVSHHPTAPVYSGYAKAINRLFANAAEANLDYFKTYIGLQ